MHLRSLNRFPIPFRWLTLSLALAVLAFAFTVTGCVTKRRVYDSDGVLVDEQTIVNRPLKRFAKEVEFE